MFDVFTLSSALTHAHNRLIFGTCCACFRRCGSCLAGNRRPQWKMGSQKCWLYDACAVCVASTPMMSSLNWSSRLAETFVASCSSTKLPIITNMSDDALDKRFQTLETVYVCSVCKFSSNDFATVVRHKQEAHPKEPPREYLNFSGTAKK